MLSPKMQFRLNIACTAAGFTSASIYSFIIRKINYDVSCMTLYLFQPSAIYLSIVVTAAPTGDVKQ